MYILLGARLRRTLPINPEIPVVVAAFSGFSMSELEEGMGEGAAGRCVCGILRMGTNSFVLSLVMLMLWCFAKIDEDVETPTMSAVADGCRVVGDVGVFEVLFDDVDLRVTNNINEHA